MTASTFSTTGSIGAAVGDLLSFIQQGFVIVDGQTGIAFQFDTYISNSFLNQARVPDQPIERNSFTLDAKQVSPNVINVTALKSLSIFNLIASTGNIPYVNAIQDVPSFKSNLELFVKSPRLLDLFINNKISSYSETYSNYTLESLVWEQNPQQLSLVAQMQFREVRLTDVSYTSLTSVSNPTDTNTQNNGTVQPQVPPQSILKNLANIFSNRGTEQ